ncbi:MAG: DUF302 domain-containing protein [Armatimonadetes bacterium]|nr:DUF302 domain-containing protein [Armatimonadota bacterium]
MEQLGYSVTVPLDFETTLLRTREALKEEGFGVVSEIDIRAVLKEKIDADFRPYTILGACNPHMAKRALEAMPEVGLLLPCNVTVEQTESGMKVTAVDPKVMMSVVGSHPVLEELVEDAAPRLEREMAALEASAVGASG